MATEDLLLRFLEITPELFCVFDRNGKITVSSRAFNRAFGFEGMDLRGYDYDRLAEIRPEHSALFNRARKWDTKALSGGKPVMCEEIISRADGTDGLYEVVRTPLDDPDGNPIGLVFSAQDVTDRIKREFDLQLLTAEQTAIFENAIIGIMYTAGNMIQKVNRTMERMTGFSREELVNREADMLFPEKGAFEALLKLGTPALSKGDSFTIEMPAVRNNAEPFQCRWSGHPIDHNDLAQGIIWCVDDIDEEKRIRRLRKDTEMIVRHDLKAPLNGVIGFGDLIRDMTDNDQIALFAGRVIDSGYQMLHMIDHSMDLFKMEEGTFVLDPKPIDLIEILRELDPEFNTLKRAVNVDTVYTSAEGNSCSMTGSGPHLKSMFGNLIKNALEASPEKTTVDVTIYPGDPVRVDIRNLGAVPEEIRNTFFNRYATSGKKGGTGLGTFSARLIARAHEGDITFTSSEKEGTMVSVTLPRYPEPAAAG